jgi:peptidoglycan/xylan/chitin deacetylase (PgdA/CDA1 family)
MAFLRNAGFPVLGLDTALDLLDKGTLPPCALVITIDDGFASLYSCAYPTLAKYAFPATIYVTTYYAEKKNPIFNIAVQYMFWKTRKDTIDLTGLAASRSGIVSLATEADKADCLWKIIDFGDTACTEEERVALCRSLGERLDVDYDSIARSRMFTILTFEEIHELSKAGFDIQLHTHRHRFPPDRAIAMQEIADNRRALEPLVTKPLVHFCYPSGIWTREQWPWLSDMGIRSAVTCDFGYNYPKTSKYGLRRFGDSEGLSQIEFEAELYGFAQILRRMKSALH